MKMHSILAIAVLILFAGCTTVTTPSKAQESKTERAARRPVVLGYYPSWNSALPPDKINFNQFTLLCHAFASPRADGGVKTGGNLPSRELTTLAHRHGVKVILSLGGQDSGQVFGPMLRNREAGERFVDAVVKMIVDYDYDGVDIDWEFPKDETDMNNLTWMARRFRTLLDAKKAGCLITSAQSGVDWATKWVDADALRNVLDYVSVMTYDMHGPWSGHAGFNAPLYTDPKDLPECQKIKSFPDYMGLWVNQKKFPKSKLLVGIPCYGRGFPVNRWYETFTRADKPTHTYVAFKNIAGMLREGWVRHWDADAEVPWLSKEGVKELISYDDEQSAGLKGRWAADNGYGGIFFWEISQDFMDGQNVLVKAATEGFRKGNTSPPISIP